MLTVTGAGCLRLMAIKVPALAVYGDQVALECRYHAEGDTLYTVKWYKNSGNTTFKLILAYNHSTSSLASLINAWRILAMVILTDLLVNTIWYLTMKCLFYLLYDWHKHLSFNNQGILCNTFASMMQHPNEGKTWKVNQLKCSHTELALC